MEAMLATRSVLIVEDDEFIRDMLKEQLADDHGFIVFTAPTLEAADKIIDATASSLDAVILDRRLPDGDGCDLLHKASTAWTQHAGHHANWHG
jgi:DNA-binding response OmpR family regulator